MTPDFKPFLKWFGFSRRERRSSFLLLLIIILIIAIRFIVPDKNINIENYSASLAGNITDMETPEKSLSNLPPPLKADPNNASFETLKSIGFSDKQAATLISYRQKGGVFREPSDLKKIYGVDEETVNRLIPYIVTGKSKITGNPRYVVQKKKTDLNLCDSSELERLPGIGPVLAARIIKYRKLIGGFISVDQLREVYGLSDSTFNFIASKVDAAPGGISYIHINKATFKELKRHPYFELHDVQAILKYRELKGHIENFAELINNKIITGEKTLKIKPYLVFDR